MRPSHVCKLILLLLAVGLPLALAQKPSAQAPEATPKYDSASEVKLNVTVEDVTEVPSAKGEPGTRLVVTHEGKSLEIRLCPRSVLQDIFGVTFAKGDVLEVTGSKVKVGDKTLILAREIVKGNTTLVLRDKKGAPVWTWLQKH
jgi:hypothetical protein